MTGPAKPSYNPHSPVAAQQRRGITLAEQEAIENFKAEGGIVRQLPTITEAMQFARAVEQMSAPAVPGIERRKNFRGRKPKTREQALAAYHAARSNGAETPVTIALLRQLKEATAPLTDAQLAAGFFELRRYKLTTTDAALIFGTPDRSHFIPLANIKGADEEAAYLARLTKNGGMVRRRRKPKSPAQG